MRYGASSKLPSDKVIAKAKTYFGKLGLTVIKEDHASLCMEGVGGQVTVNTSGENQSEVEIVTTTLGSQVKHFLQMIE